MAPQVGDSAVLNLEESGRRLLTQWSEQLLALELEDAHGLRARVAQEAVGGALYRHLWEALETWQSSRHLEGATAP